MNIGKAIFEKGDNQFIKHIHHDILNNGKTIGAVTVSLFDITEAQANTTAWKWICRERQYLYPYRAYLFNLRKPGVEHSALLSCCSNEDGNILIIDSISIDPENKTYQQELEVLLHVLLKYEDHFKAFMLPDWNVLAKNVSTNLLEMKKQLAILGFSKTDDFIATGFRQDMLFSNKEMFDECVEEFEDTKL